MKRKAKKVSVRTILTDTQKQRIIKELFTDSNCMTSGMIRFVYHSLLDKYHFQST